jgi:two-component system response regulator YesN
MTDRSPRGMRPQTVAERRRVYLQARLAVKRHYARPLTLQVLARALAASPRQIQRAHAQFGDRTFHDDFVQRRMEAAVELLSQPSILVCDVARQVGPRRAWHFARAFACLDGVPPRTFRSELHQARRSGLPGVTAV